MLRVIAPSPLYVKTEFQNAGSWGFRLEFPWGTFFGPSRGSKERKRPRDKDSARTAQTPESQEDLEPGGRGRERVRAVGVGMMVRNRVKKSRGGRLIERLNY